MIHLRHLEKLDLRCPICDQPAKVDDWDILGMHNVAWLECEECRRKLVQALPLNGALFYPGTLDAQTGNRVDRIPFRNWYLNSFEQAYRERRPQDVGLRVEVLRARTGRPLAILNTLDATYGHSLFQLFNAQYYLDHEEVDLAVLILPALRWLVPDGVNEVWTLDLPFAQCAHWLNSLSKQIKKRIAVEEDVRLCRSFVQADSSDYDVERFTRVSPFPLDDWDQRLDCPKVTFIWRSDRAWKRFATRYVDNRISRKLLSGMVESLEQRLLRDWIVRYARLLREHVPNLDFAVAGFKRSSPGFPSWIKDIRVTGHSDEMARRDARRYAESHLIVGCNGSSLLLPSALAGGCINIVPRGWWAVSEGSFSFRGEDIGDVRFRYVMVPHEISELGLAEITAQVLRDRAVIQLHTGAEWRAHRSSKDWMAWGAFRVHVHEINQRFEKSIVALKTVPGCKTREAGAWCKRPLG